MSGIKTKVLLCDDYRLVLATVSSGLRSAGYDVIEADNGDDAILLARQHRPQLAILDMRMHGKSGLDVAAYLRDYVGTPFMFLSAFSDAEIVAQAREFGALEYLVKPVASRHIVKAVETALATISRRGTGGGSSEPAGGSADMVANTDNLVAVGILMERFRIGRRAAEVRLAQLAAQRGRDVGTVAAELTEKLDAIRGPTAPLLAPRG